jgi:hypothetical protein
MTAIFAAVFMINSLLLTYMFQRDARTAPASRFDRIPAAAAPAPATAPEPAPVAPAPVDANAVPAPAAAPAEQKPEK